LVLNPLKSARYLSIAAGAYALLGGLASLLGWLGGVYRLTDWTGGGITIKANAALAMMAAASALLLAVARPAWRSSVRALGLFVALLGGLTLLEHATGWNLGIDTLLSDEPSGAAATAAPGRMGPPAAVSFIIIGFSLQCLLGGARARFISVALALIVVGISALSLTGHWYGATAMYTIPRLTGIALQTASMIFALGLGLVAASPDRQPMRTLIEDSNAGILARRLVPLVVLVPLILGWFRVRGQEAGLYDTAFGTALRSVVEVIILAALSWWSLRSIRKQDIRQRRAESELRDSERRLAHTLASITDGFVTLDREWRFTFVNKEAEELLRKPHAALIGRVVWEVFPEMVGGDLYRSFQRAAAERVMVEVEASPPGTAQYFSSRVYPSLDGGLSVYFQDITQRKQTEEALRDADRRKDEFLATLAHELRNPLAPIRSAAKVLAHKGLPESSLQWGADVITRQVQHMARLLEDLLDVSRISRNRLELRKEWVELATVVQSAVEASGPGIEGARHELVVSLPPEPVYIDGDAVRLSQVFSNLLNNAAKYTEPGGHISLTARVEGAAVVVIIKDDGIGIDKEMLPKIFEIFVQAKPALQRSPGGLGIGLSLARGVIELHGGEIEAKSAGAGQGAELIVRLPRVTVASGAIREAAPTESGTTVAHRILVVDDLKDSGDALSLLLRTLGHEVRTAYRGEEAIEIAERFRPHVMFLDIGMPGMNGYEACRRIREKPWGREIFIVALTGWGQPEDRRRTQETGFDEHLIKPADLNAIMALLNVLPQSSPAAVAAEFEP
jgi:PAS domain S-box-containing protein